MQVGWGLAVRKGGGPLRNRLDPPGQRSSPNLPYLVALGLVSRHLAFGASLREFQLWLTPFEVCDLDSCLVSLCA